MQSEIKKDRVKYSYITSTYVEEDIGGIEIDVSKYPNGAFIHTYDMSKERIGLGNKTTYSLKDLLHKLRDTESKRIIKGLLSIIGGIECIEYRISDSDVALMREAEEVVENKSEICREQI